MKILIAIFCIVVVVGIAVTIFYSLGTNSNKTCNKNEEYVGNACQCINGYTRDFSGVCTKPASINCKDPNEMYNGTTKKCDCIDGYTRDLSGVCAKPPTTECKDPRQIYNSITKKCQCKDGYYTGPNNECTPYTFQLLNKGQLMGVTDDNQPIIITDNYTTLRIGNTIVKLPSNLQNAAGFQYNYGVFKGNKGVVTFFLGNNSWGICDLDLTKNTLTYDKDSSLNKMALQGVTMIAPIDINNEGDSLAICEPLTETASFVFIKNAGTQWKWTQKNVINDPKFFVTNVAVGGPYQCIFGILDNTICMYKSSDSGNTWNSSPIPLKSITNSIGQPEVSSSVILGNNIYIGINYGLVYTMDLTSLKNVPVALENIPRMTFWKQIVTYGNVLFFLGNEKMYANLNTRIYISEDNGDTFSEPILTRNIPVECYKLFYNNNTLYTENVQGVWKQLASLPTLHNV
jgi:hypothetical protein